METTHLTAVEALEHLQASTVLTATKPPTKYIAGFEAENGRQIALNRQPEAASLFLSPGDWMAKARESFEQETHYDERAPRSSNLAANAATLAVGFPCVKVVVSSRDKLDQLIDAYVGEPRSRVRIPHNQGIPPAEETDVIKEPHNQIFFGPPGTGKTYLTTQRAVQIADLAWMTEQFEPLSESPTKQRAALKARYLELVDEQRIVFTTFHQSFSYEDFIEGIRPETEGESGNLTYAVKDGVFKELCLNAKAKVIQSTDVEMSLEGRRFWKMSLGNTLTDDDEIFQECLEEGYVLLGYGEDTDYSECHDRQAVKRLLESTLGQDINNNDYTITAVNAFKNIIQRGDVIVVSDGNHKFRAIAEVIGDYELLDSDERSTYLQMRTVRWLRQYSPSLTKERLFNKSLSQMTLYELKLGTIDVEKLEQLLAPNASREVSQKPHVIIIDEINRGNVSRIFGELITLLESSKREGAEDQQTAKLPYSQLPFCIPNNVFIIGTMNTADKSLAQMDIALRRRFNFIEISPEPELLRGTTVFGVDLGQVLTTINQRIEALLDAEHMIGHAYFMGILGVAASPDREIELSRVFRNNIVPLLQEYFFEDYERIAWVLNDPAKEAAHRFIQSQSHMQDLPALSKLFSSEIEEQLTDRRFRINTLAFDQPEAYQGILK